MEDYEPSEASPAQIDEGSHSVSIQDRDAYCRAVNAALGVEPQEPGLSWWERSWIGRLLRYLGR